jgi:hypothetical protein
MRTKENKNKVGPPEVLGPDDFDLLRAIVGKQPRITLSWPGLGFLSSNHWLKGLRKPDHLSTWRLEGKN